MTAASPARPARALAAALGLALLAALPAPPAAAQGVARGAAPPPVDDAARGALVERLAQLVAEHYVFPDVGEQIAMRLTDRLVAGAYDGTNDPYRLAELLTQDLRSVNGDLHFAVRVVPPGAHGRADEEPEEETPEVREARLRRLRASNFGFARVELLEGNVGYLDLRSFVPAADAGPTAVAAMNFLAYADALVVDVRQNGGGDPSMIQLISSYFFAEPTHLNSFFWRGQEQIDQFWTLPHVPGPKLVEVPLFVLTSGRTGSAAEEFTYNLKNLERATIVGETTAGAANPGGTHAVVPGFEVFISSGRAINPITGTNWEGVGVAPDVAVPAEEALDVAHLRALKAIAAGLPADVDRAALDWAIDGLRARKDAPSPTPEELAALEGVYGPRSLRLVEAGLLYQREGGPSARLYPMGEDLFGLEGVDFFRLRIGRDAAGEVDRLIGLYVDGRREESLRDD